MHGGFKPGTAVLRAAPVLASIHDRPTVAQATTGDPRHTTRSTYHRRIHWRMSPVAIVIPRLSDSMNWIPATVE